MDHDTQNSVPPKFEVQKAFPQRGSLRLVEHTAFTCDRRRLEKNKSKLVAFEKDKRDATMCNGCYGLLLSALEK
jgi:hypothetical protein